MHFSVWLKHLFHHRLNSLVAFPMCPRFVATLNSLVNPVPNLVFHPFIMITNSLKSKVPDLSVSYSSNSSFNSSWSIFSPINTIRSFNSSMSRVPLHCASSSTN